MSQTRRVQVLVSGRVQGVWFRDSTRQMAEEVGLRGWVRNLADGRVEALFEGSPAQVEQALAWCRRGPPLAQVTRIVVADLAADAPVVGFAVRPSSSGPRG